MWIWDYQLREMGFRQKNDLYWQCDRGFGLAEGDHLSLFLWTEQAHASPAAPKSAFELTEFHVTFFLERNHVHFYYHEVRDGHWEPGGHTSSLQLRALGYEPGNLLAEADAIAQEFVRTLDGAWIPCESSL